MPDKLSQFWQELKRRNVVRVITVYAGAAFVILSLVDMIREPFELPSWSFKLIIVILFIGLIIAVILSWIYDIHPEGGMVKTKPANKIKPGEVPRSSKGWKIASYISFGVIVGLIVLNITPRGGHRENLDKSVAVLPFIDDSPDRNNEHIINGIMEDLLINLQSIQDLRVPGRTSTEQYRNKPKSIPEIASELNVAYIVEGSGQRYGNTLRLRVQLVEGTTDKHIWADSYDEVINGPEDIFRIQSRIAKSIATELQAIITPEEKQLIEKIPTADLSAYDFYQRGRSVYEAFQQGIDGIEALEQAEEYYHVALSYDSTYALAYTGLAYVYQTKHYNETYYSENFLDSLLILADKALSFDPQLSEAFLVKGNYYRENKNTEQAILEYDKAIKYNPNDWKAYQAKGSLYSAGIDHVKSIENITKAITLYRGPLLPQLFRSLGYRYVESGFKREAYLYASEAFKLDHDSAAYLGILAGIESMSANFEKSIVYAEKYYSIDSTNEFILLILGKDYSILGEYEKSLEYYKKLQKDPNTTEYSIWVNNIRIGYAYLLNGYEKEAEAFFLKGSELDNKRIELSRQEDYTSYYTLAANYTSQGNLEEAYECLRIYSQVQSTPCWMLTDFLYDSLFDNIRDEPEFQQILKDVRANHQATHERVRQWMEQNRML